MIQSMTAFARGQAEGPWGSGVCEIRSINHRYLELSIRLPDNLHSLEVMARDKVRHCIQRGKLECVIRYFPGNAANAALTINALLAEQLCQASETIGNMLVMKAPVNAMDILRWPGVLQAAEIDLLPIEQGMAALVEKTLIDLVAARNREGNELTELLSQRLQAMRNEVATIKQHIPELMQAQRDRLLARIQEVQIAVDSNRLEQELVLLAQKTDIAEEVDRLVTHMAEVERNLKQGGPVGRRLDFLMQECHREANTLSAKSTDALVTRAAVELKVLIEQMREQVQNIE